MNVEEPDAAWHEQRKLGIGGSDAAAVLGVSPWMSPLELWGIKTGKIAERDLSDNDAVYFGRVLEDIVAAEYSRRTGRDVRRQRAQKVHPEHPYMRAHLDRYVYDKKRGRGVLQVKTTSAFKAPDWYDPSNPMEFDAPLHYRIQIEHEMAVVGADWGAFACLVGGNRFIEFDVEANQSFRDELIKTEAAFWGLVETKTAPLPEGDPDLVRSALGRLYSDASDAALVSLSETAQQAHDDLVAAKQALAAMNERKREAENKIKAELGHSWIGKLPDGTMYTWKQHTRRAVRSLKEIPAELHEQVAKETSYRVLRHVKGKGRK